MFFKYIVRYTYAIPTGRRSLDFSALGCSFSPVRGRRLLPWVLLACLLALPACSDRGLLPAPTLEPLEVRVEGRWLRDRRGRVVLLRGATYTASETGVDFGGFDGPGEETLAGLEHLGLNLVRLPIAWSMVEPAPDQRTTHELHLDVDPIVRLAAAHGMGVVLTMRHSPRGGCDEHDPAIPRWVCASVGAETDPSCAFWTGLGPSGVPLRTHFARTWAAIADHYRQDARIVGLDLLDEPAAGACFDGTPFEHEHVRPYVAQLVELVRQANAEQAIVYEPAVGSTESPGANPLGRTPLYSPHVWSQRRGPPADTGTEPLASVYDGAMRAAAEWDAPLLVGFGADLPKRPGRAIRGTSAAFARRSLHELDRHLASGFYDALRPTDPTSPGVDLEPVARVLARPYARRVAGVPTAMTFDVDSGTFDFRFDDDPATRPPDPTEIFLPDEPYGDDFVVELRPSGRWTFDAHTRRLLVYRGPGSSHHLRVRPAGG